MSSSRMSELVSVIASNNNEIEQYLQKKNLLPLSFSPDTDPLVYQDGAIARQRQAIIDATDELQVLVLGPRRMLMSQPIHYWMTIQAICKFGFATAFTADKDVLTYEELATAAGLKEIDVQRLLRHAMGFRIFHEPSKGVVAHTAASKMLAEDHMMRQWISMVAEELCPASLKVVDALTQWPGSEEPNNAGFNIAHHTDSSLFEEVSKDPSREKRYASAMTFFSSNYPGLEAAHLVHGFDWDALGKAVVVDVGGSHGLLSTALAQAYPQLTFVVQDQEKVVQEGRQRLPVDVADRVSFMSHDFFADQPGPSANVYVIRWVLHDWSDKYAIRILQALRPALKIGTRVLIMEQIMPEPGTVSPYQDRALRAFDLSMWALHNARERCMDNWRNLFEAADARFELSSVNQPQGSRLSIMELKWKSC